MIDKDTIIKLAREIYGDIPLGMASQAELERLECFAQSIYRQGLEDAADRAIDIVALHGGSVETEAHIRQELKGEE